MISVCLELSSLLFEIFSSLFSSFISSSLFSSFFFFFFFFVFFLVFFLSSSPPFSVCSLLILFKLSSLFSFSSSFSFSSLSLLMIESFSSEKFCNCIFKSFISLFFSSICFLLFSFSFIYLSLSSFSV